MKLRTCNKCGGITFHEVVSGHCNNHDQDNFQVTTVQLFCMDCGEYVYACAYDNNSADVVLDLTTVVEINLATVAELM